VLRRDARSALTSVTNVAGRGMALLGFAGAGIGTGVLNGVAEAFGNGDRQQVRALASSAMIMLSAEVVLIVVGAVVAAPTMNRAVALGFLF
jgi:Na+-driven multidrug efflux pump